jgi:hypothetical protein
MRRFALLLLAACAHHLEYTPDPGRSAAPAEDMTSVLQATHRGFPVNITFLGDSFTVQQGPWEQTVRYEDIVRIEIVKKHGDHNVYVNDSSGTRRFEWGLETEGDAKHLADAIAGVARRAGKWRN